MVVRYFCALIYLYLIDYYLSSLDDLALFQLSSIVNAGRKVSVDYDILKVLAHAEAPSSTIEHGRVK